MPARQTPAGLDTCRRCQAVEVAIIVRREPLCKACFLRYAETKVVKRMESWRTRHSNPSTERTLLLCMSFGVCSISLLYILSHHLKGQVEKTGRTGFKLRVLHVRDDLLSDSPNEHSHLLKEIKSHLPEHVYAVMSLTSMLSLEDLSGISNGKPMDSSDHDLKRDSIETLLARMPSATARADTASTLRRKAILHYAKAHDCEAVLCGDSTTKLSERTLAETAKGRGYSVPWVVAEGQSPFTVPIHYPMRDLLTKEIESYMTFVRPELVPLIKRTSITANVNAKSTTIDDLMNQYFASVEEEYPSVVANVIRTASKLQPLSLSDVEQQCELCDMPLDGHAPEKSRLCYGCVRNIPLVS